MSDKENKKTKVKIFVKLFNDIQDRDVEKELDKKAKFVNKYIDNTYMSYAMKMAEARQIMERTSNIDVGGKTMFSMSSPMRYVLFVVSVIRNYTSLEFSDDVMADFDLLSVSGAIEMIFAAIGRDVDDFNTVLSMTVDDYMQNERDIVSFMEQRLATLERILGAIDTDAIAERFANLNGDEA